MQPHYPLYVVIDDASIQAVMYPGELVHWFEQIDVEEENYTGWDVDGYPVRLFWGASGPKAKVTDKVTQMDALRQAIIKYAGRYVSDPPFLYAGDAGDMMELFDAVKRHIKQYRQNSPNVLERVRRFFGKHL